jgi:hypothetical protein
MELYLHFPIRFHVMLRNFFIIIKYRNGVRYQNFKTCCIHSHIPVVLTLDCRTQPLDAQNIKIVKYVSL